MDICLLLMRSEQALPSIFNGKKPVPDIFFDHGSLLWR